MSGAARVGNGIAPPPAGLCAGCANVREIRTRTGSRFLLCELSAVDPAFPRYPRLPVLRCRGFVPAEGSSPGDGGPAADDPRTSPDDGTGEAPIRSAGPAVRADRHP